MKIAHIVNVTEIDDSKKASYLHIAQPVTLKTMSMAKQKAAGIVDIDLVTIKHQDETVDIPDEFIHAPDIKKYAWEYIPSLCNVTPHKPLPRLADILSGLNQTSDAEYFIYTNLDIGLYPDFYIEVRKMIEMGVDACCINRIDLPKNYRGVTLDINAIDLILTAAGTKHPGIDSFVFKKDIVPALNLGNVYIGFPPVGMVLKTQIEMNSTNFYWVKDQTLTFHLGQDKPWANTNSLYFQENYRQAKDRFINCINV